MPRLLFISSINFVGLLFKSSDYSRAAFISLSQSLCWHRREWSRIERLLDRQGNLLIVADSLFWVCFVSSRCTFACVCATQVFVMPTAATNFESSVQHAWMYGYCLRVVTNREWRLIERIQYIVLHVSATKQIDHCCYCCHVIHNMMIMQSQGLWQSDCSFPDSREWKHHWLKKLGAAKPTLH